MPVCHKIIARDSAMTARAAFCSPHKVFQYFLAA